MTAAECEGDLDDAIQEIWDTIHELEINGQPYDHILYALQYHIELVKFHSLHGEWLQKSRINDLIKRAKKAADHDKYQTCPDCVKQKEEDKI